MPTICAIPADKTGGKLWILDLREEGLKTFVKYKSTYNDMPFMETELASVDDGNNLAIFGGDGTVLFRFDAHWIDKLKD